MDTSPHVAKHFRDVFFGGNWTTVSFKEALADVTWQEAVTPVKSLNTIAVLTYHIGYFVDVVLKVLEGGPLNGSDKLSFSHPPIASQEDWEALKNGILANAESFALLAARLPDSILWEDFADAKYGNYYRNISGIIEHTHYHLGQITIVKKLLREENF